MSYEPQSLQEAITYFDNQDNCIAYLAERRWPDGKVVCPGCGSASVSAFNPVRRTWKCGSHHAKREFSVKVGTVMEDSPIPLSKWLMTMWLVTNCKNGVSSYEIARNVKVTQKSAWFMLHRIRLAMQDEHNTKLGGRVEVDESFIGGKARNMHLAKRQRMMGRKNKSKTIVLGLLERGGTVRTEVVADRERPTLQTQVRKHVEPGSEVFTDELHSYWGLEKDFAHQVVNHAFEYASGQIHTNGLENFWSLVKRALGGTYVSVEPFHLFRYLDEQMFRYNYRATKKNPMTDANRFSLAVSKIVGKRLTFVELTGKVGAAEAI